jgi:glycosyltransferase involved in cell wall biosynthesis
MKMPVVLQLISSTGLYGAERVLLELAGYWRELGWTSIVGVFRAAGAPTPAVAAEAQRRGLDTVLLPARGLLDSATLRRLRLLVEERGVDLVHSHGYKTDVYAALGALPSRVRRVATCHTWYSRSWKLLLYELADKVALHAFDHVVVVSPQLVHEVLAAGVARERCTLIENGVSVPPTPPPELVRGLRSSFGVAGAERLLLRVGRLDADKGNDTLLRAIAELLPRQPLKLVLAGDGPDRAQLEGLARELGVAAQVVFAGYRDDVPALLAACDLFAICSPKEGLPLVLLEAMAARKPIVSTAVGAIPQVIEDGVHGLLVAPGDPPALAAAIGSALASPARMAALAAAAHERFAERHSQRAMGERYRALFSRLLDHPPGRTAER